MNALTRALALASLALPACATARATTPPQPVVEAVPMTVAPRERDARDEDLARLDADLTHLASDGSLRTAWGLTLAPSGGARTLAGEPEGDERIADARRVAAVGMSAAALVRSSCGNVWLVGLHLDDGAWRAVERAAVLAGAHPGACRIAHADASACAMREADAREVVVRFDSESEEGDEVHDPALRVFHLERDGRVARISDDLPFGGTDDQTGAVRDAEWTVDDALLLPRDLYVQERPGRRGPGGEAPRVIVRRTYRLRGPRLELADETRVPMRANPSPASASPATAPPLDLPAR